MQIRFQMKWVAVLAAVVLLAAVLGYGALYAPGGRPTCISFEAAGDRVKLSDALSQFVSSNKMIVESRNDVSLRAYTDELFLKWDQISSDGLSSVVLCANAREDDVWRQAAKDLEHRLLEKVDVGKVSLQRGGDYSCDRNCEFRNCRNPCSEAIQTPIDFDQLRRSGTLR